MGFLLKKVQLKALQDTQMGMWKTFPFCKTLNARGLSFILGNNGCGNLEIEATCESAKRNIQTILQVEEPNREKLGKPTSPVPLEQLANLTAGLSVNYKNADELIASISFT